MSQFRASHAIVEWVNAGPGPKRVSHAIVEWIWRVVVSPSQPTVTATADSQTQITLNSSDFIPGEGGAHIASQWQLTLAADTGFLSPVYDPGTDPNSLLKKIVTGLDPGVDYRGRVRHQEQQAGGDVWSAWSDSDLATTWVAPDIPTISVLSTAADRAEFEGSAFSSTDGDRTHAATEWQITLSADTGFAAPVQTQLVTFGDLLTFNFSGLDLWVNQYIARVRYQDDNGGWSAWSDASSATAIIADGQFYTAFAERPIGIDIADDALADWDELLDEDQSTWPIETRLDAVCQVVSHRASEDGDADTVDPIFWQGFQQVGEQIVWTRLLFEEQGGAGYPCGSGVQSDSGLICRTNLGLIQTADIENDLWDMIRDGAGEWTTTQDGGPGGQATKRYFAPGACVYPHLGTDVDQPKARLDWLTGGIRPSGQWAQMHAATRMAGCNEAYIDLAGWPGLSFCGSQYGYRGDSYTGEVWRHCAGFFLNWFRSTIVRWVFDTPGIGTLLLPYAETTQQWPAGRGGDWAFKVAWDADYQWSSYSFGSLGPVEVSKVETEDDTWDEGRVGFFFNRCASYDAGPTTTDYWDLRLCSGNTVVFSNLPKNWRIHIVTPSHVHAPWIEGVDGGADVVFDFSTQGWPADRIDLYNPGGKLVESWNVPDGIWGGDTYNINAGGLGVGPIGGAAVRLGP